MRIPGCIGIKKTLKRRRIESESPKNKVIKAPRRKREEEQTLANPIHQFIIEPQVPLSIGEFDVSFTNSSLWMVIASVSAVSFMMMSSGNRSLVPGRMQMISEMMYEFIANMVRDNIGSRGKQYFPFIFTLFMVVLMGNVLGLLPYSFTYTSHIAVTGALALVVFFMVTIYGFINHGVKFLTIFCPPGVPLALKFLIIPIELMSFLMRPFTLAVRLFANMMAGHMVLKIFAGFAAMAVAGLGVGGLFLGALPVIVNVGMLCLELLVAFLQAYVFAILSCVYLKDTVDLHH